jgi:asparagine synthase (glutamine-hydrolysing)
MRWSVESRLPFLDYRLVEYVLSLPTDFKVGGGFQKRILRDAVPELPDAVAMRRDKVGFASPDHACIAANTTLVREQILDALSRLGELVDADRVIGAFDRFCETGKGYDPAFFRLISFGAWCRAFNCTL